MSKNSEKISTKNDIISEEDIRQYVFERFNDVKRAKKIKDLVNFQAMNKYMIMAHDQEELKKLGSFVASNKKVTIEKILEEYEKHLNKAFEKMPTTKTHTNVIMHIFGYFSKNFTQYEKKMFLDLLEKYRNKEITIGNILAEINPIIFRFNNTYLASQTYFLLYADNRLGILFNMVSSKN